jgi:hypothetical protein
MPLTILRKEILSLEPEFEEASALARRFVSGMESDVVSAAIGRVHKLGGRSQDIQAILQEDLEAIGFVNEKAGLFAETTVSALRPDFFRPVGRSGIIAEVERGKTITNNMDLLDLWKCHICPVADFLFLIVPIARRSADGTTIKAFDQAARRLASFFEPRNYVHVEAVFLFGY